MTNMSKAQQILDAANALIELCDRYSIRGVFVMWQDRYNWLGDVLTLETLKPLNKSCLTSSLVYFSDGVNIPAIELVRLNLEGKLEEVVLSRVLNNMAGGV